MRRGLGPPQTNSSSSNHSINSGRGITESTRISASVNQSQGFDTSAFGGSASPTAAAAVAAAAAAAAAIEAPQPSACESSPKPQRRRTSGGSGGAGGGGVGGGVRGIGFDEGSSSSSGSNSLRRSLELDRPQQPSAFMPFSGMEEGRGKSNSGPINTHQYLAQAQQPHQQAQASQAPPPGVGSPVRRTRSLKDNLIKRFNSSVVGGAAGIARAAGVTSVSPAPSEDSPKALLPQPGEDIIFSFEPRHSVLTARAAAAAVSGGSRSSSPKKAQEAAIKLQQQQLQQPSQMNRNRAGSLRGGSVVKVLPDKKLLNKASSSENLTNQNAAAADLNSLASLVQKKRDRSQESLEQARVGGSSGGGSGSGGGGGSGGGSASSSGTRKPPTPTPAVDSDDGGSEVVAAAAKSKPPSGMARSAGRRLESPTGRGVAAAIAAALMPVSAATDDSPAEANDTDRESPGEDQQSDGEVAAHSGVGTGVGGAASGHNQSSSLEFLMQDAQSRTAPQIRHPSARKIEFASPAAAAAASARREGSPSKIGGSCGSSPPKAVSFNPNDEIKTFEGDYHSRYRKNHRSSSSSHSQRQQQQQRQRSEGGDRNGHGEIWGQGRIGDNALIEVHSAMLESMDKMVSKQRHFLSQVKDGSITVSEYREVMKTLLTMQTKTIQQILDAVQSNEKPS